LYQKFAKSKAADEIYDLLDLKTLLKFNVDESFGIQFGYFPKPILQSFLRPKTSSKVE
jgi:hypothetical protein